MSNTLSIASRRAKWSKSEVDSAQGNLFEKMLVHREQREELFADPSSRKNRIYMSRSLLLCGLPYRPTDATEITRTAKTGGGRTQVTFYALGHDMSGNHIPMPFGSDRNFLYWAIDRAIKSKNRFVPFESAAEFFDDLGLCRSGENYKALRETQRRLSCLLVMVEHFERNEFRSKMDIFEDSRLPGSIAPNVTAIDDRPMGLMFSEKFFKEFSKRSVPFLLPLLRTLGKKPQMQDYTLFLHHRSFAAETTSPIPWGLLREQLWQNDTNVRRVRQRMDEAIKALRVVWPELNAVTTPSALLIGPPTHKRYLIPEFLIA